ncbi:MAG: hypothetical protein ACOYN8_03055 [Pseudanabaena sp.]|jgi:hypothetical protein
MLNDTQITKIASLLNKVIDIPLLSEEFEQILLQESIRLIDGALSQALPPQFSDFLNQAARGLNSSNKEEFDKFISRLITTINKHVDLPFLDEVKEQKLIRFILELIVKAMSKGEDLNSHLDNLIQQRLTQNTSSESSPKGTDLSGS